MSAAARGEKGEAVRNGEAGDFQEMEKALECPICIDTVILEPSEPQNVLLVHFFGWA